MVSHHQPGVGWRGSGDKAAVAFTVNGRPVCRKNPSPCCSDVLATNEDPDHIRRNWRPISYLFASGLAGCPIAMLGESLPPSKGVGLFCCWANGKGPQKSPAKRPGSNGGHTTPPRWQTTSGGWA